MIRRVLVLVLAPRVAAADTCDQYEPPEPLAEVRGSPVTEASGLAVGQDGVLYTHGDNNTEPLLISFGVDGTFFGEHPVSGADNEDWEDLAAAPCPDDGWCLYIGDIGDNDRDRANVTVYVVREPKRDDDRVRAIERYVAVYPDGPHNAEALLVDPCTGRMSVVTKEGDGGPATVFRFPPLADIDGTVTLTEVATVTLEGPTAASRTVTGGAFDADGDRLVLRTLDRLFEWTVDPAAPDAHWDTAPTEIVGTAERQAEGVAYGLDGDLYSVGEGSPIPLSHAVCAELVPSAPACEFPQTGRKCGCASVGVGAGAWFVPLVALWTRRRLCASTGGPGRA